MQFCMTSGFLGGVWYFGKFWPTQRIFHEKNDPNSPDFNKNKNPNPLIFTLSSNRYSIIYKVHI
jgi:hypothetical protein